MSYTPHQLALIEMGQRLPAVVAALEAERENVRVLRMAAGNVCNATDYGRSIDYRCNTEIRALAKALDTTAPEGGEV